MNQRKEEEVEEIGLTEPQAPMLMTVETQDTEQTNGSSGLNEAQEFNQTEVNSVDNEKIITLHPSDPLISVDSVRTESERVSITTEIVQQEKELCLESLCQKPATQGFYCPNCKACIQQVLLLDTVEQATSAPAQPPPSPDTFRCSSCFSFIIPVGSWLFPERANDNEVSTRATPFITIQAPHQVNNTGADSGTQILQPDPVMNNEEDKAISEEEDNESRDSSSFSSETPRDEHDQDGTIRKQALQLEEVKVDEGIPELPSSTTLPKMTQTDVIQEPGSSKTWEILKSIVYGGLTESLASLSIVTSSASSDATTLNILVPSLANLMGGLFILVHNVWDLKSEEPKTNNQKNAHVDLYYQVLGKRENFYLHVFIAILSFITFGLVPPLVYAFTFNNESSNNNKALKLAAVLGGSAICIALLSIAKAYIQRRNTYLKTVLSNLTSGVMASIVSFLAGGLFNNLLKSLDYN